MNQSIRILIVDDNPYFLQAAREFLLVKGGLPLADVANSPEDALLQAEELQPDLLLLDINLAGHSGLEFIPVLKQKLPGTRIIAMTMMQGSSYRSAALQAGADQFVFKNEINVKLLPIIEQMIDSLIAQPPLQPPHR